MLTHVDFARQILLGGTLDDKLVSVDFDWGPWTPFELPALPGRDHRLRFSPDQLKFPKAGKLREPEKKALALHSFANHELLAIEMMAAALLIYPHHTAEDLRFKRGILSALKDEQKHLSLYLARLRDLGYDLGDFPLNDFFWRQMDKLKTPAQYLSVMALTFEAANLDFAQYYAGIFRQQGDLETAGILETVLEDELSHVAFGAHWLKRWRGDRALWQYYLENLPWPMTPARSKGIGFDPDLHRRAIGDEDFMTSLRSFEDPFRITRRS
jgi:uncharacterized ferritin-like protein (DUF455 family)